METKKKTSRKTTNPTPSSTPRLYRSETSRVIAGVCGGIAEYFNVDPSIIRIFFVFLTIFGGSGFILYLVLWLVLPSQSQVGVVDQETIRSNAEEIKSQAQKVRGRLGNRKMENSRFWWGMLIIFIGVIFLSNNLGIFGFLDIGRLWPLFLILVGLSVLTRK